MTRHRHGAPHPAQAPGPSSVSPAAARRGWSPSSSMSLHGGQARLVRVAKHGVSPGPRGHRLPACSCAQMCAAGPAPVRVRAGRARWTGWVRARPHAGAGPEPSSTGTARTVLLTARSCSTAPDAAVFAPGRIALVRGVPERPEWVRPTVGQSGRFSRRGAAGEPAARSAARWPPRACGWCGAGEPGRHRHPSSHRAGHRPLRRRAGDRRGGVGVLSAGFARPATTARSFRTKRWPHPPPSRGAAGRPHCFRRAERRPCR